ncbi:tRNA-dihydrouridine synthase, partial [Acinetobacter baumannii]
EGARIAEDAGADIIDINMGCPVKKVCNSWCGSALLQDEELVARILDAVVSAVDVPVTLKFRTGWNRANKNALKIAARAEAAGIAMLTL